MPRSEIVIHHEVGLHARPAAMFVKLASSFPCTVSVRNVTANGDLVNAKSILSVLTLGVVCGHTIEVVTDGERAEGALAALEQLIVNNFAE